MRVMCARQNPLTLGHLSRAAPALSASLAVLSEELGHGKSWKSPEQTLSRRRRGEGVDLLGKIYWHLRGGIIPEWAMEPRRCETKVRPTVVARDRRAQ
jgi:hypothetical protein